MKTPLESEPHRFGRQWCLFFNPQYLCGFSGFGVPVSNWTQNWKNPKKRIRTSKMNESEPPVSNYENIKKYFICRRTPLLFPSVSCICSLCAVVCNCKIQYVANRLAIKMVAALRLIKLIVIKMPLSAKIQQGDILAGLTFCRYRDILITVNWEVGI